MAGIAGLRNGLEASVTEPQTPPEQAALSELYDEVCLQCDPLTNDCVCSDLTCSCLVSEASDLKQRVKEAFLRVKPDGDADCYWNNMVKMATHLPEVDTMSFWRNGR